MKIEDPSALPFFLTEEVYVIGNDVIYGGSREEIMDDYSSHNKNVKETHLKYSGSESYAIVVLVDFPESIPSVSREFLFKILSAIKLTENDITLINMRENRTKKHEELLKVFPSNKIIAFGTTCTALFPDNTPLYSKSIIKQRQILRSDELDEISKDVEKKKQLWNELKNMFLSKS